MVRGILCMSGVAGVSPSPTHRLTGATRVYAGGRSMYRQILVPVDGSGASQIGLQQAILLTKDQKATLRLLHVVHDFVVAGGPGAALYTTQLRNDLHHRGEEILKEATA